MRHFSAHRMMILDSLQVGRDLIASDDDAHYLRNVLRCKHGSNIRIFNKTDGEYLAQISEINKKNVTLNISQKLRPTVMLPHIHLALSIIKQDKFLDAIDMATQLGVTHITPIICEHSNQNDIKYKKASQRLKQSTEQSERFAIPLLLETISLNTLLSQTKHVIYANERIASDAQQQWPMLEPITVLIGPEGGFSDNEIKLLKDTKHCHPVSLGPTILRSETATAAILSYIQINRAQDHASYST